MHLWASTVVVPRPQRSPTPPSAAAVVAGQPEPSGVHWCLTGFYSFLETRDWDFLVHKLPWAVIRIVFIEEQ